MTAGVSHPPTATNEGRVSVLRNGRLVPLLPNAPQAFEAVQRRSGLLVERHAVGPGEISVHEHPDLCLHLQVASRARFEWWSEGRNSIEHGRPGSLILIPRGTSDRLRWLDASDRLILSIDHHSFEEFAQNLHAGSSPTFQTQWNLRDPALGHVIGEIGDQAGLGWPLGGLYFDLLRLSLQSLLVRRHSLQKIQVPDLRGGLRLAQLRRAMEFINEHLADDVRLDQIAHELKLNPFHFAHEFRTSAGQTPYQYLLEQRIEKSKGLLRSTRFAVQTIAAEVGYHSPVNFVRAFRNRVGVTPGEWRRRA